MPVQCANCGEELLGAVNRCWRCGHAFVSRPGPIETPPIRRAPVQEPLDDPVIADVVEGDAFPNVASCSESRAVAEPALTGQSGTAASTGAASRVIADTPGSSSQTRPIRRGSPFAVSKEPAADSAVASSGERPPAALPAPAKQPNYPRHAGASAGAVVSILLGLTSLLVGFGFPLGALITASLGLGMGSWGLYSRRRRVAIVGLLLCCLAMAIAGFNGVVDLYTYIHGVSPWETADPEALP